MLLNHSQPRNQYSYLTTKHKSRKLRLLLLSTIAICLWAGYKQVQSYLVEPEALFVLGGHEERECFAAKLAQKYPHLPIWVSSGSPANYAQQIFERAGISSDRLHLDYQASDTVTNFTSLVAELKDQGIDSVYLITSDNHMSRARLVGEIVFGSQGIILKPISVPSQSPPESWKKSLRDGARAILWLTTGHTGASITRSWLKIF